MTDLDDDTEITEMHTPRIDLVSKAANGTRFFSSRSPPPRTPPTHPSSPRTTSSHSPRPRRATT